MSRFTTRITAYGRNAALVLAVTGCAGPPRVPVGPPTDAVLNAMIRHVFLAEMKLPGKPMVSKLRAAHPVSPGDWIVCLRSNLPEQKLTYALYFTDKYILSQAAVQVDQCFQETYAPLE
jgi:hypothetical protein